MSLPINAPDMSLRKLRRLGRLATTLQIKATTLLSEALAEVGRDHVLADYADNVVAQCESLSDLIDRIISLKRKARGEQP